MLTLRIFFAAALLTTSLAAQRHKLTTVNAETPEGQLLQSIGQENDPAKKTSLMEDFIAKHPKHEGAAWVLDQLTAAHLKASQFDKAIASGTQLLALDPEDLASSHNVLKAAEGKKDAALIQKWAASTSQLARKIAASPKPSGEDEAESWKNNVDYAKQVDTYTDYALYAGALAAADPAGKVLLYDALQSQSPQSQYLPQLAAPYFFALRQSNQNDKALAFADKLATAGQANEDMLLLVADNSFRTGADKEKTIAVSLKLAELMAAKPKPDGVPDADWTKRKDLMTGLGYYYAGATYFGLNKFADTDVTLRKALPPIQANPDLKAQLEPEVLFFLGLANYKMGEPKKDNKLMAEALKFNAQCAAIKSKYQGQATKNAAVIRQQYGLK